MRPDRKTGITGHSIGCTSGRVNRMHPPTSDPCSRQRLVPSGDRSNALAEGCVQFTVPLQGRWTRPTSLWGPRAWRRWVSPVRGAGLGRQVSGDRARDAPRFPRKLRDTCPDVAAEVPLGARFLRDSPKWRVNRVRIARSRPPVVRCSGTRLRTRPSGRVRPRCQFAAVPRVPSGHE